MMGPGDVRCGSALPLSKSDERCLRRGISSRAGDSGRIAFRALGAVFQKSEHYECGRTPAQFVFHL